jgi:hypothetical protein
LTVKLRAIRRRESRTFARARSLLRAKKRPEQQEATRAGCSGRQLGMGGRYGLIDTNHSSMGGIEIDERHTRSIAARRSAGCSHQE